MNEGARKKASQIFFVASPIIRLLVDPNSMFAVVGLWTLGSYS